MLERGKKIIQTWRVNEELWPESHFSEVVILLSDIPEEGCRLDFYHTAIPATMVDSIKKVWHEYYWEPLRFYLER